MNNLEKILSTKCYTLDVSWRIHKNFLLPMGDEASLADLLHISEKDIKRQNLMGPKSMWELKGILAEIGIPLDKDSYTKPAEQSYGHQGAGMKTFDTLSEYEPFLLAVKTYWVVRPPNIPFMHFLKVFESYARTEFLSVADVAQNSGVNADTVERILRKAVQHKLIPQFRQRDRQKYETIRNMVEKGFSAREVAREMSISSGTVYYHMNKHGLRGLYEQTRRKSS